MKRAITKTEKRLMFGAYRKYKESTDTELYDVYNKVSNAKKNAMEYCKELMHKLNGRDLRIISHTVQFFTVGFEFPDEETGELNFAYITKAYDRFITV